MTSYFISTTVPSTYTHSLFSSLFQYKDTVPAPKSQFSKTLFESSRQQQMLRLLIFFTFSISVVFSVLIYPNPSPLEAHRQSMKQKKSFASFKMIQEDFFSSKRVKFLTDSLKSIKNAKKEGDQGGSRPIFFCQTVHFSN